ncbi:MAG: type II toxin-antitoxin system VapC family toxin [Candidatus Ozemobacteraceae bacterium]
MPKCNAFISQIVLNEIKRGDAVASSRRINLVSNFQVLAVDQEIIALAEKISQRLLLPEKALADAFHISVPAVHEIDYLVTWNCTHIANAFQLKKLRTLIVANGYKMPCICTPEEMMEIPNA